MNIGGWGCPTGKWFRFVSACVRAVWLPSGIGYQKLLPALFPFPHWAWGAFPFLFWGDELSFFPSPHPQTSYPTLVGLIGIVFKKQPHIFVGFLNYLFIKEGVQGPTFGRNLEISQIVENNIGNHLQALITNCKPILDHENWKNSPIKATRNPKIIYFSQ